MPSLKERAFGKLCDKYCLTKKCGEKASSPKRNKKSSAVVSGAAFKLSPNADPGQTSMQASLPSVTTAQMTKRFGHAHHDDGAANFEGGYGKEWSFQDSHNTRTFRVYERNDGRRGVYRIGSHDKPGAMRFKKWLMKELRS